MCLPWPSARISNLYVGGRFQTLADGTTSAKRLARWDGSAWHSLGGRGTLSSNDGVDSNVYALAVMSDAVYVGGFMFGSNDGRAMNQIGYWDISDDEWYALGNSVNGPVYAVAVYGEDVYVGGSFTSAGGVKASAIARWNQSTRAWSAVGSGVSGCRGNFMTGCAPAVYALVVDGSNIYVGGNFTAAGGGAANGIAYWNTTASTWNALGDGVTCSGLGCNAYVRAIDVLSGHVYAGGNFDYAGGSINQANNIAVWDGNGWGTFGNGTNGTVYAVLASSTSVSIGGGFTTPAVHFAKWTSGWNSLGGGFNNTVYALHQMSGNAFLYAGGAFTDAGGVSAADHLAGTWGSTWEAVGNGFDGDVNALTSANYVLYAGGAFTISGTTGMNRIGFRKNSVWSGLGSGVDDEVNAIAYDKSKVYVGGVFLNAGGKPSTYFGRWGVVYKVNLPLVLK